MKTFINFRSTTPLHYAKERWCDYLKPHSKLNTQNEEQTIEAIPKDQYETRLRADMVAMLKDLRLEIEEIFDNRPLPCSHYQRTLFYGEVDDLILDKINALKG